MNGLHSHTIKPFEFMNQSVVFYGLGNFLFFHPSKLFDTKHSIIVKYYFYNNNLIQIKIIPILVCNDFINIRKFFSEEFSS